MSQSGCPNRPLRRKWAGIVLVLAVTGIMCTGQTAQLKSDEPRTDVKFDAARAYGYLVDICRIGPRMSGSQGMAQQQKLIVDHFTQLKAQVRFQSFDAAHPLNGAPIRMSNIIVSWHPDAKERILLACHYDTRPYPDRNRRNLNAPFIGANDGASGVAFLMELGNHIAQLLPNYGIDFVFFDGEEFIFDGRGEYFLGSERFAHDYVDNPPEYRYVYGVVFDMIADRNLAIYKEKNSVRYASALTDSIWDTARRLDVDVFHNRIRHDVSDDHIPLNQIAKIPSCDIIDFDFGRFNSYWHTSDDTPAVCSGESLAQVGTVILEWLKNIPPPEK